MPSVTGLAKCSVYQKRHLNPDRQHSDLLGHSPACRIHLSGFGCRNRGHCLPCPAARSLHGNDHTVLHHNRGVPPVRLRIVRPFDVLSLAATASFNSFLERKLTSQYMLASLANQKNQRARRPGQTLAEAGFLLAGFRQLGVTAPAP